MTATVEDLLKGKPEPVTTRIDEPLREVLARMMRHDYSQLPVVGDDRKPVAVLTSDGILRALNNFDLPPGSMRVSDAMDERIKTCRADDDVLDILDDLRNADAVLVLDSNEGLSGIITTYDTTEYFRRRAQDIMLVQDIEEFVKDYVLAAFRGEGDGNDEEALRAAIEEITPSNSKELRGPFQKAIEHYLSLSGNGNIKADPKLIGRVFDEHLFRKGEIKPFGRLSLNEYIDMLLHKSRWEVYQGALHIDREALRRLLYSVRNTRNGLAHFRTEITEKEQDELRFCRDWLSRQESAVMAAFAKAAPAPAPPPRNDHERSPPSAPPNASESAPRAPVDEAEHPDDSRYAQLAAWLQAQPSSVESIVLKFSHIESIINGKLPSSAREHRSWWANDTKSHPQSRQWLHAGWRVASVNPRGESVTFVRDRERERSYAEFFASTAAELKRTADFEFDTSPTNYSWLTIRPRGNVASGVANLNFSFARSKQLRVELYIDCGEQDRNKRIFDALYRQREEIDAAAGESLSWERIDGKRASRIAAYRPGAITDDAESLEELRSWAVSTMIRLAKALREPLARVLESENR
ncbi:DUF4268 domain-containing protein [Sorangium sp. So ce834]|uniref:DUF4268 domain-containing protein n=1 Tax=Sorangium sp. So ce834 TaxID=3133321 RepID=UPI003F5FEF21